MKSVLFFIPLKKNSLKQYETFAKQTVVRKNEYKDLLKRYDIHSAKVWHKKIGDRDYILVYHEVGPQFEERMKSWDTSEHPFDKWFRDGMMAVYDIEDASGMEKPHQLVDFIA
jgi:hypothetical protein